MSTEHQQYSTENQSDKIREYATQQRLVFVAEALRQLLADEHFSNLLRAEGLDTLPKQLAERVWSSCQPA